MSEDASLDEFLGADGADSDADEESEADGDEAPKTDGTPADGETADDAPEESTASPEPATPTYASTPEGAACGACGEVVTERWREDGAWACPDCKEW